MNVGSEHGCANGALRVLLLGGVETRFHQFELVVPPLTAHLKALGHDVTAARPDAGLTREQLSVTDVIVSITTGGTLSPSQMQTIDDAMSNLGRDRPLDFLGLHGASCSFDDNLDYRAFLGGRFLRHPPMGPIDVRAGPTPHRVTAGVAPFRIVDELYVLELEPDVDVILQGNLAASEATASAATTSDEPTTLPLGWVRRHGLGRVCYFALGHGPEQLAHPSLRSLIRSALWWFGSEEA